MQRTIRLSCVLSSLCWIAATLLVGIVVTGAVTAHPALLRVAFSLEIFALAGAVTLSVRGTVERSREATQSAFQFGRDFEVGESRRPLSRI